MYYWCKVASWICRINLLQIPRQCRSILQDKANSSLEKLCREHPPPLSKVENYSNLNSNYLIHRAHLSLLSAFGVRKQTSEMGRPNHNGRLSRSRAVCFDSYTQPRRTRTSVSLCLKCTPGRIRSAWVVRKGTQKIAFLAERNSKTKRTILPNITSMALKYKICPFCSGAASRDGPVWERDWFVFVLVVDEIAPSGRN